MIAKILRLNNGIILTSIVVIALLSATDAMPLSDSSLMIKGFSREIAFIKSMSLSAHPQYNFEDGESGKGFPDDNGIGKGKNKKKEKKPNETAK